MRKMVIALLMLGLVTASSAFAGSLLNEGFTYPNGNLVGNDGWVNYSGSGDIQVVSYLANGQMGVTASGGDDHTLNPSPLASYFAGLNATATPTTMVARVYVLPITGGWTFGLSNSSTASTTVYGATPWGSTPLACDTWYHIVIKYDPTVGTSTMWVNPVNQASASITNTNNSNPAVAVNTFFLRQGAASAFPAPGYPGTGLWKWSVDNVGVGTTFDNACYSAPVPVKAATWGHLKALYR